MGRPSPERKRAKRSKQKAKRKLFGKSNSLPAQDSEGHDTSEELTATGDIDLDHVEMCLYDSYRQLDGEDPSQDYLLKCRSKLMDKVRQYKEALNKSQEELLTMQLAHKKELERVRRFYETIAFGKFRTGRIVRAAMGTSKAAKEIMDEMTALYSVSADAYYS